MRTIIGWIIGVGGVLVAYALIGLYVLGWAWPYPVFLPDTFSFRGNTYHRDPARRPLSAINRGAPHLHRVGSLPSALWFGDRAIYSYTLHPSFSTSWDYVVVEDGGCYRFYEGDKQV
jgi:hypothetical protein